MLVSISVSLLAAAWLALLLRAEDWVMTMSASAAWFIMVVVVVVVSLGIAVPSQLRGSSLC